jgi:amino acid adenylation domain-containing protein
MTATEILSQLRQLNITIRPDKGQLVLSGPKGALTSDLRSELVRRKEEILNVLDNTANPSRAKEPLLRPISRNRTLPLSFAQQRLWFLDQYEPKNSVYNIPYGLRLVGPLKVAALEQSLREISRRHEALRTTFSITGGDPVQVISPALSLSMPFVDLTDRLENAREEEAQRLAHEEAGRPFDLRTGPLFRAKLIRLGELNHLLLLTLHHIVSDGWSMAVLYRELSILYRAFINCEPSPLAGLPIQYADYAVWQREYLEGEVLESQLSYWKNQLEGIPGVLHLPTDHPRPAIQSYRGERQSIELSKELTQALKALSRKEGATLFMTLLAAFQTLLHRYTGQDDIVVGSPIANRNRTEIEGLIGFFVNTLVLRSNFSVNPTFTQLLAQVREMALGAYAHQDLPFEKLVEALQPERSLSHSPLFQVMFVFHNVPASGQELSGLISSSVKVNNYTTKFDLHLSMSEQAGAIKGTFEYSSDLFDDATITRMISHCKILLEGIITNPDQRVSDLPILTETEKHQRLVQWNDTKKDYPQDTCIHQLFEAQAEKTPDAIAVVFEDQQLTYRVLNQRANQLARYLKKFGVGAETMVGIRMERSLEMIIGIIGILKAGGAYVPLDPSYPKERLVFMLEDTQTRVLLIQERLVEPLSSDGTREVCLDRDWQHIARESSENLDGQATATNLAYVIYTSGSTGRAKGVLIPHHAVINVLTHVREALDLTEEDTVPLVANICFDISVMELFLPLIVGGRLIVATRQVAVDGAEIEHMLSMCGATIMHATPATWRLLLQAGWNGADNLTILSGGEALQSELADQLVARGSSLWNLYGPTETTIYSSASNHRPELNGGRVSIGRPIANTQAYILDHHLQPVPIGVAGQLHIGGNGLARGYLNQPDLTVEKFIPNAFSKQPGARLYQTGDVARYLPDGNIEFLGRIDHQVKIRGFRIELGEIEAVLSQHPAVRETVVLAREEVENPKSEIQYLKSDKRLVAYIVSRNEQACTINELRSFLRRKLPEAMVPTAFVFLDAFPRTLNGKLDRGALPIPNESRPELERSFVAPRTPAEELLAEIWAKVLKVERVGIHDNFFDLGGHSLKATQVISRVREALRLDLSLRVLFEAPTVAELSSRVEQIIAEGGELEELARNMAEVEALSDEEIERQLEEKT